ncbi:MAG: hypothetical protein WD872_18660 [Pirellulaceae bacterium]
MSFLQKIGRVLSEAAAQRRARGSGAAARFFLRHVYSRSTMVLFESREKQLRLSLPASLDVVSVSAAERAAYSQAIDEAGAGSDVSNFDRGATAWLILADNVGVAVGWRFTASPLFRPLGYDPATTIYLGGYHVLDAYRGRGLYPYLVQRMFADTPAASCAIAETSQGNASSQRGLTKAGFTCRGLIHRTTVGGSLLGCRLVEQPGRLRLS